MNTTTTAGMALPTAARMPPPPPPPPVPPAAGCTRQGARGLGGSGGFAGIAALGAGFAGVVAHGRDPDALATAMVVGITFFGAFFGLHLLQAVFRLTVVAAKIAIPGAILLAVGCALYWPWAEVAVDWLRAAGSGGLAAAERIWAACQG